MHPSLPTSFPLATVDPQWIRMLPLNSATTGSRMTSPEPRGCLEHLHSSCRIQFRGGGDGFPHLPPPARRESVSGCCDHRCRQGLEFPSFPNSHWFLLFHTILACGWLDQDENEHMETDRIWTIFLQTPMLAFRDMLACSPERLCGAPAARSGELVVSPVHAWKTQPWSQLSHTLIASSSPRTACPRPETKPEESPRQ